MADFSVSALLDISASQQSLRRARSDIEDSLGDVSVTVDAAPSGGGVADGGTDIAALAAGGVAGGAGAGMGESIALAEERNELLREQLEVQEATAAASADGGGGGGGLLTGLLSGVGLRGILGAIAPSALIASGATVTAGALISSAAVVTAGALIAGGAVITADAVINDGADVAASDLIVGGASIAAGALIASKLSVSSSMLIAAGASVAPSSLVAAAAVIPPVALIAGAATISAGVLIQDRADVTAAALIGGLAVITAGALVGSAAVIGAGALVATAATIKAADLIAEKVLPAELFGFRFGGQGDESGQPDHFTGNDEFGRSVNPNSQQPDQINGMEVIENGNGDSLAANRARQSRQGRVEVNYNPTYELQVEELERLLKQDVRDVQREIDRVRGSFRK